MKTLQEMMEEIKKEGIENWLEVAVWTKIDELDERIKKLEEL